MAPIIVISCYLILVWKAHATIGILTFVKKYKTPVALTVIFHLILILSLFFNISEYGKEAKNIILGFNLIAAQSLVFVLGFLFILPQNQSGFSLTNHRFCQYLVPGFLLFLGVFSLLINLFPYFFFYWIEYSLTFDFYQYLVSQGNGEDAAITKWANNSSGVFAATTDLGSISAIIIVYFAVKLLQNHRVSFENALAFFIVVVFFVLGALSHSLSFFLILAFALFLYFVLMVKISHREKLKIATIAFSLIHYVIYLLPIDTAYKLKDFLPYMFPYRYSKCGELNDFIPNFNLAALGERGEVWQISWQTIIENPFLGVSNGAFRLNYLEFTHYNTHNLFLQTLIDSGLIGLIVLLTIGWFVLSPLLRKYRQNSLFFVVFGAAFISLMVDYYADHSIPWILVVSYLLAHSLQTNEEGKAIEVSIPLWAVLLSSGLFFWTLWDYQQKSGCFF